MDGRQLGPERFDTVVVGGGQAGLATGYYLARLGRPFVILDAGQRIGDTWRNRWDSLRLFTPAPLRRAAGHGLPAPRPGTTPPRTRWPTTWRPTRPGSSSRSAPASGSTGSPGRGDRYLVTAGERRFEAANVVVASGAYHAPADPRLRRRAGPGHPPAPLQRLPATRPSSATAACWWSARPTPGPRSPSSCRPATRPGCPGRTRATSRPGAGGRVDRLTTPAVLVRLLHRCSSVGNPIGRKAAAEAADGGGPAGPGQAQGPRRRRGRAGAEDGRSPRRPAPAGGRRGPSRWPTSSGAPGSGPTSPGSTCPSSTPAASRGTHRGVVASQPGLYFVGLHFLTSIVSPLVGGVGHDAEHVVSEIAGRKPAKVAASA